MLQKLSSKEIPILKQYLAKANYPCSTYNVVGLFLWQDEWPVSYYQGKEALFLFIMVKGQLYALAPLTDLNHLKEALLELDGIFKQEGKPMQLAYLPPVVHAKLEVVFPGRFDCVCDRGQADYIYEAEKLRKYAGKKMQKKRNNLNYFVKNYGSRVTFKELDSAHCPECNELIGKWMATKDHDESTMHSEQIGVIRLLSMTQELDFKVGGVFIDGVLEAFSICSLINPDCVQVNVEKADGSIRGLYQYLVSQMLQYFYPSVHFVNREDDMGLDSLRQSKESYYPCDYWYVFTCVAKAA